MCEVGFWHDSENLGSKGQDPPGTSISCPPNRDIDRIQPGVLFTDARNGRTRHVRAVLGFEDCLARRLHRSRGSELQSVAGVGEIVAWGARCERLSFFSFALRYAALLART